MSVCNLALVFAISAKNCRQLYIVVFDMIVIKIVIKLLLLVSAHRAVWELLIISAKA